MTREELLKRAEECVNGEREGDYGSPEQSFQTIANFWTIYLGTKHADHIEPEDVAIMMMLLKVARLAGNHATDDSLVDIAGYAACCAEIMTKSNE